LKSEALSAAKRVPAGDARFFLVHNNTKIGKNVPKLSENVPNGHKISQMYINYSKWPSNILTFSNLRPSKIYPNWDFWFEINHLATLVPA
jgi:hypothetical protein